MPGPISHLIVQRRLGNALNAAGDPQGVAFANQLLGDHCSPYTAFGAIGPEFLLFCAKDYGDAAAHLVNGTLAVYDAMGPLLDAVSQTVAPAQTAIQTALTNLDQTLFQNTFHNIATTLNLVSVNAFAAIEALGLEVYDPFYHRYPRVQQGQPEPAWFWRDFLRSRKAGQFCSTLWKEAAGDTDLQKYALGYASHFATAVAGEPFINAIVGGPYRMHWRRNELIHKWVDAYARHALPDTVLPGTKVCLGVGGSTTYSPDAISSSSYYQLTQFPNDKLPTKLSKLWLVALSQVYGGSPQHPPMLTLNDLNSAYGLWQIWFRRSTTLGDRLPPLPVPPFGGMYGPVSPIVAQLMNSLSASMPPPPSALSAPGAWKPSQIHKTLKIFAKWMGASLHALLNWIVANAGPIMTAVISAGLQPGLAFVNWLLYQIDKALWEIYDNLRFYLVLGAIIFPEPRDLVKYPWAKAFLNTDGVDLTGGPAFDYATYPLRQVAHTNQVNVQHHLAYPNSVREDPHSEPMPKKWQGLWPDHAFLTWPSAALFNGHVYANPAIEQLLTAKSNYPPNTAVPITDPLDSATQALPAAQFGSALQLCARLIGSTLTGGHMPNFNLDADRGYAWKTWAAKTPSTINDGISPVTTNYVDAP
jgi:hypothetical protein